MKSKVWLLSIIFLGGCTSEIEQNFIIPQGFKGVVTLICEERCGEMNIVKSNIVTYEIPLNGILITQNSMICDIKNRKYFFKNSDGNIIEIPRMSGFEENRDWTRLNGNSDSEREIVGVYDEFCGFKSDNGFNSQSFTIMSYNEFQDSIESPFFSIRNHLNILRELRKCKESSQ
jgi:hypothetical protein